jgi:hypothetical protein
MQLLAGLVSCLSRWAGCGVVRLVPGAPGELAELREANVRLRAACAELRQLMEAKDAEIAAQHAELGRLRAQVADLAPAAKQNRRTPPGRRRRTGWVSPRRSRCGRRPAAGQAAPRGTRGRRWS